MIVIKRFTHYEDVFSICGVLDAFICDLDENTSVDHWYYDFKINDLYIYFVCRIVFKENDG